MGTTSGTISRTVAAALCTTCFLQTALQNILVRYTTTHLEYSHSFTTLCIQYLKLLLATAAWFYQGTSNIEWRFGWTIPAICYAINGRLVFLTLSYIDGGTFQILGNLKIITTVLWSIALLNKRFSQIKWIACIYLTLGGMMIHGGELKKTDFHLPYILILVQVILSGFAGVIMEKMLVTPKEGETFAKQCMQLYIMGLPVLMIYAVLEPPTLSSVYYSPLWLGVVINGSLQGLVIGSIMKLLGTIPRLIATICSVAVTMTYSHIVEHTSMSMMFKYGLMVMILAVVLYQSERTQPKEQEQPLGNETTITIVVPK